MIRMITTVLLLAPNLMGATPGDPQAKAVLQVAPRGAPYASVQAAIDAAPEGAVVRVAAGVYEESLTVGKPLVLEGAGWEKTAIAAPQSASLDSLKEAVIQLQTQIRAARSEQEKKALSDAFLQKHCRPALRIQGARDVRIRGLKFAGSDPREDTRSLTPALLIVRRAKAEITECAVLGSPRDGIQITDGSEVDLRQCLIAAVWGTGVTVGERGETADSRATVADCDIRNCRYAGIAIRKGQEADIRRCWISGAAWHGICYDDASPSIVGNRIFGNACFGIHASGKTAAMIRQCVFLDNEMFGICCRFENADTITENTLAGNREAGLIALGSSRPQVHRNIFFNHPRAVVCSSHPQDRLPKAFGDPDFRNNLFWQNPMNLARSGPQKAGKPNAWEEVKLPDSAASLLVDPRFVNPAAKDFTLAADSAARREGVGAAAPLGASSPWPLQPEEKTIIPEGPSRDSRLWKKPPIAPRRDTVGARASDKPPAGPPPPIVLLYHADADVRIRTIESLSATRDPALIDDLIRAHAVEFYTPVHNAYFKALQTMTGERTPRGPGAWKAWLAQQVSAGRLKIDYLPFSLDALPSDDRAKIQPLVAQLGPEHFDPMVKRLTTKGSSADARAEALRYLVANDHREEVQKFLSGDWLGRFLALDDLTPPAINILAYHLNALADPGPLRERINAQMRDCLDSKDPIVLANTLHVLAGVEGFTTRFVVPDAADKVRKLLNHPAAQVAAQARRAIHRVDPKWAATTVSYEEAFVDLYEVLGREYPCFALKNIDWKAVGKELLPRIKQAKTESEFGLLCLELVARLEDSHAALGRGSASPPAPPMPRFDPGLACLIGDQGKPVVYYVDRGGPAEKAGVRPGMTVLSVQGKPAEEAIADEMNRLRRYSGYSSDRYLQYHAAQFLMRQMERGAAVSLEMRDDAGQSRKLSLPATLDVRYLPRLPVPIPGIRDSANVSWTMLEGRIGYVYIRRVQNDLIEQLDRAIAELKDARGLIVDVRGNSGGGFDGSRAHRNFAPDDREEPHRPRFKGPIALLIDSRCISAGEGWASWFVATKRAKLYGEATAGASSRKRTYVLKNGLYSVTFPVKAYTGFLDRPIERRGLEPDVPVRQNVRDLAAGRDTVLEAAKQHLESSRTDRTK